MKIPFHKPLWSGNELQNLAHVLEISDGSGDGYYTKQVSQQLQAYFQTEKVLLTASASLALEMAVRLAGVEDGDEVIMPSFNFPSAANAVLLAGGRPVFVETGSDLMLDPEAAKRAITKKTRGMIVVQYGGAVAEIEAIVNLAQDHHLWLVEDAAQGFGAYADEGRPLGSLGDFGVVSYHGTKVASAGEGGVLIVNQKDPAVWDRARRMHQKGTDRHAYLMGQVDRYSWQGMGMSACPSEFQMAVLLAQLDLAPAIIERQRDIWYRYKEALAPYAKGCFFLSPKESQNGHIFWLRFHEETCATAFQTWMGQKGIAVYTHFVPLHTTDFGAVYGGMDQPGLKEEAAYQTLIMRLPIYAALTEDQVAYMITCAREFFKEYDR